MPLNAYDASVGVFVRGLANLKTVLTKAETHAAEHGMESAELLEARLAPDMYTLAVQAHWAAEGSKLAVGRLVGKLGKPDMTEAKSFADIHRHIDATVAHLLALDRGELEGGLERTIEIEHRGGKTTFRGAAFLLEMGVPGFFFHVAAAYGILRHKGVLVTKGDFMGGLG